MTVTPPKSTSEVKVVQVVRPHSAPILGGGGGAKYAFESLAVYSVVTLTNKH